MRKPLLSFASVLARSGNWAAPRRTRTAGLLRTPFFCSLRVESWVVKVDSMGLLAFGGGGGAWDSDEGRSGVCFSM